MCRRDVHSNFVIKRKSHDMMTIDSFNRITGQETLHPLVGIADLSADRLEDDVDACCNFYALLCNGERLRLVIPGESLHIPAASNKNRCGYTGVLFHPDILCDTPLEHEISSYTCRCNCCRKLCDKELRAINDCISLIARELQHSIDRFSSAIIVSQIGLLLNHCKRICCQN